MPRAPPRTAMTRWRRWWRAGPAWCFSISGCRTAGSMACSCSNSLKMEHPELPIVMISGHGNIETAVSAIKRGAYDFIEKPFKADRLLLVAERALENSRLKREVKELKQFAPLPSMIVGHSPAANQLRQTVEKVAPTNSRILIVGASGSGKELAARTIHTRSARANAPFMVINAAAITPEQHGDRAVRRGSEQRHAEPQGWRPGRGARRHAVHRRNRRHAARDPEQDLARPGRPDIPACRRHQQGNGRREDHLLDQPQYRSRHRGRQVSRRPLSSAFGGPDPGAVARRAARGHSRTGRIFHVADFACDRTTETHRRLRRARRAAIARLARQRTATAQQRGAADDPCRRRS